MADQTNPSHRDRRIHPKSGYCPQTKTFHTLRPPLPLPPLSQPLSITHFALSLLQSSAPAPTTTLLIDSESGRHVSYENFICQVHSLTLSLQSLAPALSKGHVAFILSPTSLHVPVLYFSLLALGVVVSPANPIGSESEIAHQVRLSRPAIAFATSATAHKLPRDELRTIILLDSPEFLSMLNRVGSSDTRPDFGIEVSQTDSMSILFSSGTTGRVKGVLLTHRNFIAQLAGHAQRREPDPTLPDEQTVSFFTVPMFHVYGFFMLVLAVTMAETLVLRERFDFEAMLRAVERYKVSYMPVSPPLIVSLGKSELAQKYDLSSLRRICCGGAPLGKEVAGEIQLRIQSFCFVYVGRRWCKSCLHSPILCGRLHPSPKAPPMQHCICTFTSSPYNIYIICTFAHSFIMVLGKFYPFSAGYSYISYFPQFCIYRDHTGFT
ncbi:4-coumarate--CoA ligase-like 9 [Prunus yedoensis var. nudiflora]|uniref:4-coumarate--CoA ligase-like 9 n=1 Tax=Prunus yedoensis var. nudiflora TaxID=2094558 RepID=A0A314ZBD7_PRUYE|nr:4-coumarate--CoA ligase-like 9 [Prunus yedoensis var. nudiflora]